MHETDKNDAIKGVALSLGSRLLERLELVKVQGEVDADGASLLMVFEDGCEIMTNHAHVQIVTADERTTMTAYSYPFTITLVQHAGELRYTLTGVTCERTL